MGVDAGEHYTRIAGSYDENWAHSPKYVDWMSRQIHTRLRIQPGDRVADVGAGTGLFLKGLGDTVTPDNPLVCIDPSAQMLAQLPDDPRFQPLQATAEKVANQEVSLPYEQLDALLIKEAIHHFSDIPTTVHGLANLLAPAARFLVVSLPPVLDYPLFNDALERFAKNQPEPRRIGEEMSKAGLDVDLIHDSFPVRVDRDHYLHLVSRRWMSVLSTFTDEEITAGLEEIKQAHPEPWVEFHDRFAFILGIKPQ